MPRLRLPDAGLRRRFRRALLGWYRRHRRDLPWRRTRDPYRILVSEIMLQQTQVGRVVSKYREFVERYPTFEALARARPAAVRKLWYPLGYNARPLHLHAIARETVARYGGRLPEDGPALTRLPGIGRYTAGALLSFAFGRDAPLVDTNVRRVLGRIFLGPRRLGRLRNDRPLWALSAAVLPPGQAYDWNQALMDFGATWCTPRAPRCPRCPMRGFCVTYPSGPPGLAARARPAAAPSRSRTLRSGPLGPAARPTGQSAVCGRGALPVFPSMPAGAVVSGQRATPVRDSSRTASPRSGRAASRVASAGTAISRRRDPAPTPAPRDPGRARS